MLGLGCLHFGSAASDKSKVFDGACLQSGVGVLVGMRKVGFDAASQTRTVDHARWHFGIVANVVGTRAGGVGGGGGRGGWCGCWCNNRRWVQALVDWESESVWDDFGTQSPPVIIRCSIYNQM